MTHGRRKACCSSGDMVTSLFTGRQAAARHADTQPAGTRAWPGGDVGSPEAPSLAPQRPDHGVRQTARRPVSPEEGGCGWSEVAEGLGDAAADASTDPESDSQAAREPPPPLSP